MASIKFIPQKLMNIALRLKRERIQKSHFSAYHKLTPVSDVPLGEYENAILYALSETDIRNIAITGVYGAGKSSLIKTFENKYKDNACFNFLNVSLASFVLEKNAVFNSLNDTTQNSKKNETQDIEKSLLQQIIYKVKSQELEDSQFSRIKIKRFCLGFLTTQFWFAFFLFSLIISISFVFKPTYFLFNESWLFKKEYATYFKVVVLIGVLGLIQLLLNWIPKLGLSKLSAGGAEISFNEKKGDSILNKHLDELIYFFATTRFNIVIFEDLDRLPNREILIKLREINQLINNSEEINHHGKNKIVKFVYALGDDLFTDPIDRTKFFDFIIPVIPIVNYSNSRKKLEDAIRKTFPKIDIQAQFLDEVTQFLDDMRLLFNISNEFIIYKRGLDANSDQSESKDKLKLDNTKLLALVIYKNKYPDDFGMLNQRQGLVWSVLSTKEKLIEHSINSIKSEISEIRNKLLQIEAETLNSLIELRRLYLGTYWSKHPDMYSVMVDGAQISPEQLIQNDSLFESFIKQSNSRYRNINSGVSSLESFSSIEKEVDPTKTYESRHDLIVNKYDGFVDKSNSKIQELERQLEKIVSSSFNELAKMNPDVAFSGLNNEHSLIKYLILEGLIGEDFLTYITYFYSGELTSNDQQFLLAQLSNAPLNLDYKLDSPEKIFEKIKEERFRNTAILNIDLFNYLSESKANTKQFNSFIETILDSKEVGSHFVYSWFKKDIKDSSKKQVLNRLTKKNAFFWNNIFDTLDLTNDERTNFIVALLEYLDTEALNAIDRTDFLQFELNKTDEIFNSLVTVGYEKLTNLFKLLRVVFSSLEQCKDPQLLEVIENTDSYELNIENLVKILSNGIEGGAGIIPTYTYINANGSDQLKKYVQRRLNWFVGNVLLQIENVQEVESSILELLNSRSVEYGVKVDLIESVQFKISTIDTVDDQELWASLLEFRKTDATWINVIKYFTYAANEIDEVLISYLNDLNNAKTLSKGFLSFSVLDESQFAEKIIYCDDITDECYKLLINSIRIIYGDLSDLEVSTEKIKLLLDDEKFNLSSSNHEFLKTHLPYSSYVLIEQHFEDYLKDASKFSVLTSEFVNLIKISNLTSSQKLRLINTIPEEVIDEGLANAVFSFVLEETLEKPFNLDFIERAFNFNLSSSIKTKLFNRYAIDFNDSKIVSLVNTISSELSKLNEGRHSFIPKNEENLRLSNVLESRGFVSCRDYKKDPTLLELIPRKKIRK